MTDLVQPAPGGTAPEPALTADTPPGDGSLGRRLAALAVLVSLVLGLAWLGHAGWRALQDAFVAPLALSPDSAPVVQNKLRLTELELERARALAEAEAANADAADADAARSGLISLQRVVEGGRTWTQKVQGIDSLGAGAELANAARRESVLTRMILKQQRFVELSRKNLEAGLITRLEHEREEQKLDELALSVLDAQRSRLEVEVELRKVRLGQRSLAGVQGVPLMPEVVTREDLSTRVDTQLLQVEARKRSRLAERRALLFRVDKLGELIEQLQRQPLYQATETPLDVAFVPYSELDAVHVGAGVLKCTLVIFGCRVVGRVQALIPGEVIQPDPWGTSERGQYALLEMTDRSALQARTLRVRRAWDEEPR